MPSWQETSPGLFERPLGIVEKPMVGVIAQGNPREPLLIHDIADFSTPYPSDKVVNAFRDAWKALRLLKSPDVAATFENGNKHYKVPTPEELKSWVNQTFRATPVGTSVQTAVRDMQNCLEWLPACSIHPQPTQDGTFKGSIILYISHWRTEAGGAFIVLNDLFNYASELLTGTTTRESLSKHVPGSEVAFLTPTLEDIVMSDTQSTVPETKARVTQHFSTYYSRLPCIDYPTTPSPTSPPTMKLLEHTYTPTSTSTLISTCKPHSISVTAAIHAAYLSSIYATSPASSQSHSYASLMPADIRKRLPPAHHMRNTGCWNASSVLMLSLPPAQDFLTNARSLREQYTFANRPEYMYEDTREILHQLFHPPPGLPPTPESLPWFTSLGVLDKEIIQAEHGRIKIEYVSAWADSLGPGIVMRVWTFRSRLTVQIAWNGGFHRDEQIEETMERVERCLKEGFGVEMKVEGVRREVY